MKNEPSSIKPKKSILSAKILAWHDLLIGTIPLLLILFPLLIISYCFLGFGISNACGFGALGMGMILVFIGPLLIINLIFGIFSFKYLRKNSLKGIKFSLIPKIIFIVVTSVYLILLFIDGGGLYEVSILIPINIFLIILIGFVFFVKKQLLKSLSK